MIRKISIVAAIGEDNSLGANNKLLWDIKEDLAFFKRLTTGCPVIMGRKTFDSMGGKALPNRLNIVVTNDKKFTKKDVYVANSIASALKIAKKIGEDEIFVVGGSEIYKQVLESDLVDYMYITHVHKEFKEATVFFPKISSKKWKTVKEEEEKTKSGIKVTFSEYERLPEDKKK